MLIKIRKTLNKDLDKVLAIFRSARKYMRDNNNFSQWSETYPDKTDILNDICQGVSFVGENENEEIVMTFAFILGDDPTYKTIEDGDWLNNEPYGTIHRIASNGKTRGIMRQTCEYCFDFTNNIRIDTHRDNRPMLKALKDLDFKRCGIIICRDGTPRIAFQKTQPTIKNFSNLTS